eukprot:4966661-Lingulodinium_polyedra.AAC.1
MRPMCFGLARLELFGAHIAVRMLTSRLKPWLSSAGPPQSGGSHARERSSEGSIPKRILPRARAGLFPRWRRPSCQAHWRAAVGLRGLHL